MTCKLKGGKLKTSKILIEDVCVCAPKTRFFSGLILCFTGNTDVPLSVIISPLAAKSLSTQLTSLLSRINTSPNIKGLFAAISISHLSEDLINLGKTRNKSFKEFYKKEDDKLRILLKKWQDRILKDFNLKQQIRTELKEIDIDYIG